MNAPRTPVGLVAESTERQWPALYRVCAGTAMALVAQALTCHWLVGGTICPGRNAHLGAIGRKSARAGRSGSLAHAPRRGLRTVTAAVTVRCVRRSFEEKSDASAHRGILVNAAGSLLPGQLQNARARPPKEGVEPPIAAKVAVRRAV
jgi:hypothetical protein